MLLPLNVIETQGLRKTSWVCQVGDPVRFSDSVLTEP